MEYEVLDYLNQNSLRSYPIREGLGAEDVSGVFMIPTQFIVDMQISATNDVTQRLYISQVNTSSNGIVVTIADTGGTVVGTFTVPLASPVALYTIVYLVPNQTDYAFAQGRMVVGYTSQITSLPAGIFQFLITATELEPKTIVPAVQGVSAFTFTDSTGNLVSLSGNVNIVARNNLRFRYDSETNSIIFDAGNGLGLNVNCQTPTCVQSINGVVPDSNNNINLLGIGCASVISPEANTLTIDDECCTPCSGCTELATLTQRATTLEANYINLKNFYAYLDAQLSSFINASQSNCTCA